MLKLKPYMLLVCLMAIYMFTTLTYRLWPVSSPNRIVGFLIFLNVIWIYINHLNKKKIIILFVSCCSVLWALVTSVSMFSYISDGIYFLVTILLLVEINNDHFENQIIIALEQSTSFIKCMVVICDLILCIGFFDSRCYDSSQWDGAYYIGYTNASHTMAAGACLLLALSLYMIRNKKNIRSFMYFFPSIVAIMKSGARTFLIPIVIVCLLFYIYHIKKISVKLLIFPIVIIGAALMLLNSSMMEKFAFSVNNQYTDMNYLGKLTNGRTAFWIVDLLAFSNFNILQKLIGNGFSYVYMVNKENFDLAIWAHNDFINCLLSVGIIGGFLYVYVLYKVCKKIISFSLKNIIIKILLLSYVLLPAFLNGFYTYQHYFYSFVILVVLYEKYYCEKDVRDNII